MNRERLEREVRRLAPWYYAFDLDGVRTDTTEPFDHWGHRRVEVPLLRPDFWSGRRVLDLGCNEGAYSFSAVQHGALSTLGIDVRAINVEKARLVASVLGTGARSTFDIAEVDAWLTGYRGEPFDIVLLCGLLYHLPKPAETLRRAAALARKSVVVTSVLAGGTDGYTRFEEQESIGASADPGLASWMPNTAATIVRELRRCGFEPSWTSEERSPEGTVWGGCLLIGERPL